MVDHRHEIGQGCAPGGGNLFQRLPEFIFEANTRLVAVDHHGSLDYG